MNTEKLKKDIGKAIEMVESLHDDAVGILVAVGSDTETGAFVLEVVSGLATLKWFLEHVSEGVSA